MGFKKGENTALQLAIIAVSVKIIYCKTLLDLKKAYGRYGMANKKVEGQKIVLTERNKQQENIQRDTTRRIASTKKLLSPILFKVLINDVPTDIKSATIK